MAKKLSVNRIDEETREILQNQVKRGKLRRFLILYKGTSVKTLIVFKRGTIGSKIMAAKRAGFSGNVLCGIVIGSDKTLRFLIPANETVAAEMNVDSWETELPLPKNKLRTFFAKQSMAFKPTLSLVKDPLMATKQGAKQGAKQTKQEKPTARSTP